MLQSRLDQVGEEERTPVHVLLVLTAVERLASYS